MHYCVMLFMVFSINVYASILDTKHNLSSSGTGTVKSSSEGEVCVFCHIPHNAQTGKPLWNRVMPSSSYTMYSSDYLERFNYPTPDDLGASNDTPGQLSRQCLSCHDGTVAIGDVYVVRGTLLGNNISVSNTNANGTLKSTSSAFIGQDLSAHHPVGIEYNPSLSINFGTGTRSIELKTTPSTPIKTYSYNGYTGKSYVECSSCHDPHKDNTKFLRVDSGGSHGANIKATCTACHQKDGWAGSVHDTKTNAYSDTNVSAKYGTNNLSTLGCINCHTPHFGEGKPYLLRKVEQNTCFEGAGSSSNVAPCHGTGGAKNIQSVLSRSYGHGSTMLTTDGVHSNLDFMYGTGISRTPIGSKGISWNDSKHVECMDCHNQHKAKAGSHSAATSWYPANNAGSNLISTSGPLTGATGVEPTWPSRWTQPTSFKTLESATKEYQVCMKCHSYNGVGTATNGVTNYPTFSDATVNFTDQAWEFNPNNRSAHPVVVSLNNLTGSYAPKALRAGQMRDPWKNVGNQTMMCSDCHGADNENSTDPKGPHGSSAKFMLKGANKYWPKKPDGTLYRLSGRASNIDSGTTWNDLFCKNCHLMNNSVEAGGTGPQPHGVNKTEMDSLTCVTCHVAVPHGSSVSRFIGYETMPSPYNYNGNSLKVQRFKKTSSSSYDPRTTADVSCAANDKHYISGTADSYP